MGEKYFPGITREHLVAIWSGSKPTARSASWLDNYPPMWETLTDGEYVLFTRPGIDGVSYRWRRKHDGKWCDQESLATFDDFESEGARTTFRDCVHSLQVRDEDYFALCEWDKTQKSIRDIGDFFTSKAIRSARRSFSAFLHDRPDLQPSKRFAPKSQKHRQM